MKTPDQRLAERVAREREAWSTGALVKAQSFKARFLAAFNNPHSWKMEEERKRIIRNRCVGATVLDYGCYDGKESSQYLEWGAERVIGVDISETAILRARAAIQSTHAEFHVADAHDLPLEANSVDLVVGRAILHHLQLETAYLEIKRVLRKGGLATFVEPLRGNPGARIIRLLTPKARTEDELPLNANDIRMGDRIIGAGSHAYSGFCSTPVGLLTSLFNGAPGSWIMRAAGRADEFVGRTPLKYWAHVVYLYFNKAD